MLVRTSRPTLTEASISEPVKIRITTSMPFSGDVYFKLLKSWSQDAVLLKPRSVHISCLNAALFVGRVSRSNANNPSLMKFQEEFRPVQSS